MSRPLLFISRNRVKEGKLEDLRQFYNQSIGQLEKAKPGTVMHLAYASDDGRTMSFIHAFPDGEAMIAHMSGADERASRAYEFIETARFELYGPVPDEVLDMFQSLAGDNITLVVEPDALGGYMHLTGG